MAKRKSYFFVRDQSYPAARTKKFASFEPALNMAAKMATTSHNGQWSINITNPDPNEDYWTPEYAVVNKDGTYTLRTKTEQNPAPYTTTATAMPYTPNPYRAVRSGQDPLTPNRYGVVYIAQNRKYAEDNFGGANADVYRIAGKGKTLDLTRWDADEAVSAQDLADVLRRKRVKLTAKDLRSHDGEEMLQIIGNSGLVTSAARAAGYDAIKLNEYVEGGGKSVTLAVLRPEKLGTPVKVNLDMLENPAGSVTTTIPSHQGYYYARRTTPSGKQWLAAEHPVNLKYGLQDFEAATKPELLAKINTWVVHHGKPGKSAFENPTAFTTTAAAMPYYQAARRESKLHPGRGAQDGLSRWLGTLPASKRAVVQKELTDRRSVDAWHVGWGAGQGAYAKSGKARERQTVVRNPAPLIPGYTVTEQDSGWPKGTEYRIDATNTADPSQFIHASASKSGKAWGAMAYRGRETRNASGHGSSIERVGEVEKVTGLTKAEALKWIRETVKRLAGGSRVKNPIAVNPKTKLDLYLDAVASGKGEVTFDVRDGYTQAQKDRIVAEAEARGLHASSDGKHILVRDLRGVGSRKSNPESDAADVYEDFHGVPSQEILEVETPILHHKNLAALGELVSLKVQPAYGRFRNTEKTLSFADCGVTLSSNESKNQLYLSGGDQSLPLGDLGLDKPAYSRDLMLIGTLHEVTYNTKKKFDKLKSIDYYHGLGEKTKERPVLLYNPVTEQLSMAGGAYEIRDVGIVN